MISFRRYAALITFILSFSTPLLAQVQQTRGIDGWVDPKGRSPELSVRVVHKNDGQTVSLLVDGEQVHDDYSRYPLRFDFYVNRRLFSSQFRSSKLPGPVGVDIGQDIATPPFNYSVVASTISPDGKSFSTVITGAVFNTDLRAELVCSVTVGDEGSTSEVYTDSSVSTIQEGDNQFTFDFEGLNPESETATLGGSIAVISGEATARLVLTISNNSVTDDYTGTITFDDDGMVERLSLEAQSSDTSLLCTD